MHDRPILPFMSYARIPAIPSAAPAATSNLADTAHDPHAPEQPLSANAQAWRRLAQVGYHRTAELVRATQPAGLSHEATHDLTPHTDNAHHSGFQGL